MKTKNTPKPVAAKKSSSKPSKATIAAKALTAQLNAQNSDTIHDEPMDEPTIAEKLAAHGVVDTIAAPVTGPTPAEIAAAKADDIAQKRAARKADRDAKNAARKAKRAADVAARKATREAKRAQLAPRDVYVSDREYFLTKGALPFGHARWEFQVDSRHAQRDTDVFVFTGKFGPAKMAAKKHFAELNINSVEVVVPLTATDAMLDVAQPSA